jgi:hypothetical protein
MISGGRSNIVKVMIICNFAHPALLNDDSMTPESIILMVLVSAYSLAICCGHYVMLHEVC